MKNCELVYLISSIAYIISENATPEELGILAATFTQLGDTLALLALQK